MTTNDYLILGLILFVLILKSFLSIKQKISDLCCEVKNFTEVDKKLIPFDIISKIRDNKYLDIGLCLQNLSNQVIVYILDMDQTSFIVKFKGVSQLIINNEKLTLGDIRLFPYSTHTTWVEIADSETLPIESEFEIYFKMHLKYNAFFQLVYYWVTCEFKGTFIIKSDDKGEKSVELVETEFLRNKFL